MWLCVTFFFLLLFILIIINRSYGVHIELFSVSFIVVIYASIALRITIIIIIMATLSSFDDI